jgi:hypothetical protein
MATEAIRESEESFSGKRDVSNIAPALADHDFDEPNQKKPRLDNKNDEEDDAKPSVDGDTDKDTASGQGLSTFTDKDVLSGRGGGTNLHPGNRFYRELILSHRSAYDDASKTMKPEISRQIVNKIRDRGGRFLRKDKDGLYYEIGEGLAREKTSQALRHRTFELRNIKDPSRVKMNGRWKQSGNQEKSDTEKVRTTSNSSSWNSYRKISLVVLTPHCLLGH